jgi:hypothetical protein
LRETSNAVAVSGMGPYIERHEWEDFHTRLNTAIADAISPAMQSRGGERLPMSTDLPAGQLLRDRQPRQSPAKGRKSMRGRSGIPCRRFPSLSRMVIPT